ncbi:MAG TPA: winged helix-turn-helix domain-containing protein, partial [Pyrinomonadaceae bacterium]|nr:winged helix-turn-helix domain-containing protein [Pyrinomonadaceae bacterium]
MTNGNHNIFEFDDVRVEPSKFKIWKAGAELALEPKTFQVLLFLMENRGRLIEKNELLDAVWQDTFVTENAMTREIAKLRKVLGDGAKDAKYIQTVHTRGYRFIAEVKEVDAAQASEAELSAAPTEQNNDESTAAQPLLLLTEDGRKAAPKNNRSIVFKLSALLVVMALAAAGVWFVRNRQQSFTVINIQKSAQITNWSGLDDFPSMSPDGNTVAYCSDHNGSFEIYVKQTTPGAKEIQLTGDGGQNFQPAFSPDGQRIAYYSKQRGGIWVIPASGGEARQITDFGSHPAWSPDGEQIAFQSSPIVDFGAFARNALPPSTLWLVSAQGGEPKQLTQIGNPSGGHGAP